MKTRLKHWLCGGITTLFFLLDIDLALTTREEFLSQPVSPNIAIYIREDDSMYLTCEDHYDRPQVARILDTFSSHLMAKHLQDQSEVKKHLRRVK